MAEEEETAQQQEQTETSSPSGGGVTVGGVQLDATQLPYAGILVSAVVLLVALTVGNGLNHHKYYGYGISVAVIAMFFSLGGLVLNRMGILDAQLALNNNYFLFAWNFIGACFMTFGGPFKNTSNGYFASWGLAAFAAQGLGITNEVQQGVGSPLMGLLTASVITMVAIISDGFNEPFKSELIYTFLIACLSVLAALFLTTNSGATSLSFPIMAFFAINWIVAASLVTFRGPYLVTGNGYFGAWGGAVTSIYATMAARPVAAEAGEASG